MKTKEQKSCLVSDHTSNDSYSAATPYGGGKSGRIQFDPDLHFKSPTSFDKVVDSGFSQGYQAIRRN